jgi:hypothetical protein
VISTGAPVCRVREPGFDFDVRFAGREFFLGPGRVNISAKSYNRSAEFGSA